MNKELLEKLVNRGLICGADFSEIFYEDTIKKKYEYIDQKLDKVSVSTLKGVGIRLALKDEIIYGSTNNLNIDNLDNLIDSLNKNFGKRTEAEYIKLVDKEMKFSLDESSHNDITEEEKKNYLIEIDKIARSLSDKVIQVSTSIDEYDQSVIIANSYGVLAKDKRIRTSLSITVILNSNDKTVSSSRRYGKTSGYKLFDTIDIEREISGIIESATKKLHEKACPGGNMPVVLGSGFGAVIFHEACGHAMEATQIVRGTSILCDKINKEIASPKVNITDDGTLDELWGTANIDDEGNDTQCNILIENGVLKKYLVDILNGRRINHQISGSGRRENYLFAPTSRMNNTYLLPGNDNFEDMIKSIDFGLYAKYLNGGSVDSITGEFNFGVDEAYIIRNGKICELVKGASLIGNTLDILKNIEMVSSNLGHEIGMCGSDSGSVPVCVGQPCIKVSSILVGGEDNDK